MQKISTLIIATVLSGSAFANGLGEDRPYQFNSSYQKQVALQSAIARETFKDGGYRTNYNYSTSASTSIGNQVIVGDNSDVSGDLDQGNTDSDQSAVGIVLDDGSAGKVGTVIDNNGDTPQ